MMILGPLVAPRTSTVTDALPSLAASEVMSSPSTTRTTGRVTDSPTPVSTLSISMTSPTATFCWVAPARTIAYTAVSFVDTARARSSNLRAAPGARHWQTTSRPGRTALVAGWARVNAPRVNSTDLPAGSAKRCGRSALAGAPSLDRDVQRGAGLVVVVLVAVHAGLVHQDRAGRRLGRGDDGRRPGRAAGSPASGPRDDLGRLGRLGRRDGLGF